MGRNRVVIAIVVIFLAVAVTFFIPRHRRIDFVKDSGIKMRWDSSEKEYVYAYKDWTAFQSFLEKKGYVITGSVDVAGNKGIIGLNTWEKDGHSLIEGPTSEKEDECMVRDE